MILIGFSDNLGSRNLSLESLMLNLYEANIKVVYCTVTEYKPFYGSTGTLLSNVASKAVILCETDHGSTGTAERLNLKKLADNYSTQIKLTIR